jgi:catechol 2,3-dioxygenase-like lactoylglutathione lyase family enzyme
MPIAKTGIEGIQSITFSTDQWEQASQFYADWGLTQVKISDSQQEWRTLNGSQVFVIRPDAAGYAPAFEPGPTLREVAWAVHSASDLDEIALKLASVSGFQDERRQHGFVAVLDPHGLQIKFVVNQKVTITAQGSPSNSWGHTGRIDAASPIYERAEPVEIGHVVLFTQKLLEAENFYAALGFVTSDRYPGRGIFMRCSAQGGHHDLFLLQVPGKAQGLNHIAFTVRDIHEVFGGGLHMDRCGWKTQLGPGRHPISSAYFWYFDNPCGGLIEYNADEDRLTENWQPRAFEPSATMFAEWAVDGGLDGNSRRQKSAPTAVSGKFITEKK